jgi:hypothetical protein
VENIEIITDGEMIKAEILRGGGKEASWLLIANVKRG